MDARTFEKEIKKSLVEHGQLNAEDAKRISRAIGILFATLGPWLNGTNREEVAHYFNNATIEASNEGL